MLVIPGDARNVTSPLTATVIALANNGAGLIRVHTSSPHFFGNGDGVFMSAAPAIGQFYIVVIDGTHFDLVGSTYTTTGTGTALDLSLTPQFQAPTDGDTFSQQLSGALSALQALADRTQFLALSRGNYHLLNIYTASDVTHATSSAQWGTIALTSTSTWMSLSGGTNLLTFGSPPPVIGGGLGDLFVIDFGTVWSSVVTGGTVSLGVSIVDVDAATTSPILPMARSSIASSVSNFLTPYSASCMIVPSSYVFVGHKFNFSIQAFSDSGTSNAATAYGAWDLVVHHYRPNL